MCIMIKFPTPRNDKGVKCPGYAREGMLNLRFDGYINVMMPSGKTTTLVARRILPSDRAEKVRQEIYSKDKIPPKQQCLLFSGKKREDVCSLCDYNIKPESVLRLDETQRVDCPDIGQRRHKNYNL